MSSAFNLVLSFIQHLIIQGCQKAKSSKSINIFGVEQTQTYFGAVLDPQLHSFKLETLSFWKELLNEDGSFPYS